MAKFQYDNLEDIKSKFLATVVYYDGVPVYVKDAMVHDDIDDFNLLTTTSLTVNTHQVRAISDPKFNLTRFNIGYANYPFGAIWWYRFPGKQYQQGLKANQLKYKASISGFEPPYKLTSVSMKNMLMNDYPTFKEAVEATKNSGAAQAFHKNFAVLWDEIHKDAIIEYKGRPVGHMYNDFQPKFIDEFEYLKESFMGAINV